MKKSLILVVVGLVVAGGGAFAVVGMAGTPKPMHTESAKRGTDAYYTRGPFEQDLGESINVNVKGTEGKFLAVGLKVKYRLGDELMHEGHMVEGKAEVGKAEFDKAMSELRHRLTILLSNKSASELIGVEHQKLLQQEILEEIQHAVFPEKLGRIENVFFKSFLMQ